MPRAKQYVATVAALENKRIAPAGVKRLGVSIQNTGLNPGRYRFENAVQLDGGDVTLVPGAKDDYLIPGSCPADAINLYSVLGTTFAIIEILEGQ